MDCTAADYTLRMLRFKFAYEFRIAGFILFYEKAHTHIVKPFM